MLKTALLSAVVLATTISSVAIARADMVDHRMERRMMHQRMERQMMHRRMEHRMMRRHMMRHDM